MNILQDHENYNLEVRERKRAEQYYLISSY
jgi:hypothetical protein